MSALLAYEPLINFASPLICEDEVELNIEGYDVLCEFSTHAFNQRKNREIFKSACAWTVEKAFSHFFGLENHERFIIIDRELDISVVASFYQSGGEMVVSIITVIDSNEPNNPYDTYTIEV
jgi:hypothetical protein